MGERQSKLSKEGTTTSSKRLVMGGGSRGSRRSSSSSSSSGAMGPWNCLAMFEYTAAVLYLLLFLLAIVDTGATLNNSQSNSVTQNITALVMLCVVSATLGYSLMWLWIFCQHVGTLTKGTKGMAPFHFRPMRAHFFSFAVFLIILEILVVLFYFQVSGYNSAFQDRYVGDTLTNTLDVRIYISWQVIKCFIFSFGPLEALLFTWSLIQHRNGQEAHLDSLGFTRIPTKPPRARLSVGGGGGEED